MNTPCAIALHPAFSAHPVPQAICQHPLASRMVAGGFHPQRKRSRSAPRPRALLCMDCGHELTGDMHPIDAIHALWNEYGWHMQIGKRLCHLSVRVARQVRAAA